MAYCPVTITDVNGKELSTRSLIDLSYDDKVLQIIVRSDSDAQKFIFHPNLSLIGSKESLENSTSSVKFCHFITEGEEDVSAISTCSEDNITGIFKINGLSFILRPNPFTKSFAFVPQGFDGCSWESHSRKKRLASYENPLYYEDYLDGRRRYIELVFLADTSMYNHYHSNKTLVLDRLHSVANVVDSIYSPLKIRVVLTWAGVWEGPKDLFVVSRQSNETLKEFSDFSRQIYLEHNYDHAQFVTRTSFEDNVIGKAYKGTICTRDFSVGVISDHSDSAASVASTVAHEMGHSLGMDHDTNDNCICENSPCIMAPSNGGYHNITHFSTCSLKALSDGFRRKMDQCLFNVPKSPFGGNKCGNGIVEEGEECDCGNTTACPNKCCIADKCKLAKDAICASGDCCDFATCKPLAMATMCRSPIGICDLPEYCDGETGECPPDFFFKNGALCPGHTKDYCYEGVCGNRDDQCEEIWGPPAQGAEDVCYRFNTAGADGRNCGTKLITTEFIKCEPQNAQCGKVFCNPKTDTPKVVIGDPSSVRRFAYTTRTTQGSAAYCHSVETTYMAGPNQKDITIVRDGAYCGNGDICVDQKCTNLSSITELVSECDPKDCSKRGVCNNVGNCHCEPGYGGVACNIPGYGGSINSGPATDKMFNAIPYLILLLGSLTLIFMIAAYLYHRRTGKFLHKKMWIWFRDTFHIYAIHVPVRRAPPPPGGRRRPNPNDDLNAAWGDPQPQLQVGKGPISYPRVPPISSPMPVADSNPRISSPPIIPIKPEATALNPNNRNGDSSSSEENCNIPPPVPPHRNVSAFSKPKHPPPTVPKPVVKPKPKIPTKPPVVNDPVPQKVSVKDLAAKFNAKNSNVDIL